MDFDGLYDLVVEYFGKKASNKGANSITREVTCVLYETFACTFNVNDQHGAMFAGVILGNGSTQSTFFGKSTSFETDPNSMKANLEMVDHWCRTQLTDKFLEAFEAST